ncbi:MAG: nucleotide sugar dehydrogenase, partial [Bacteroidota bacterium]|nr:nucleotide sugar dehydrogenase [Bacteroidota bacterium]
MAKTKLAIVGLGYVGLPLAVAFAKKYSVVGFDVKKERINELEYGYDATSEVETNSLKISIKTNHDDETGLFLTSDEQALQGAEIFIVTVPTPVDIHHHPDL